MHRMASCVIDLLALPENHSLISYEDSLQIGDCHFSANNKQNLTANSVAPARQGIALPCATRTWPCVSQKTPAGKQMARSAP
mmetsp:Transcript_23311/g.65026  ORF Transcript_23311/g.65026 Transcript_23311/m.65026 type:complete len:82 (-) Transcript_23311:1444-1689(-)